MVGVIICNGEIKDYTYYGRYFEQAGLIVCADGGAVHARRFGIKPHILMGDFDSISEEDYGYFKSAGIAIEKFPEKKDMTDTEIAVDFAIEKGCETVIILGGTGSRLDHSLSNILLLKKMLDRGVKGFIVNEHNEITLINDSICLQKEKDIKVSLLAFGGRVEGVTTKGLLYPLDDATIELGSTWGVSNEFVGDIAEVTIRNGLLLVIKSRD